MEYMLEERLYRSLFPDDNDVKEEELRDVTITNFLINGQ